MLLFSAIFLASFHYTFVIAAIDEEQHGEFRKSPDIFAIHLAPDKFAVTLRDEAMPSGRVADNTIITGGGVLPYIVGSIVDAFIDRRRTQQQHQQYRKQEEEAIQLVRNYALADPITIAKSRVLPRLVQIFKLDNIRVVEEPVARGESSLETLKARFDTAHVLIKFQTLAWGIAQLRSDEWVVYYRAAVRFVGLQNQRTIADARCQEKTLKASSLKELTDNDAAFLKASFGEAAQICADEILGDLKGKQSDIAASVAAAQGAGSSAPSAPKASRRLQGHGFSIVPPLGNDWHVRQDRYSVSFGNVARSRASSTFGVVVEVFNAGQLNIDSVDDFVRVAQSFFRKEDGRFRTLAAEHSAYRMQDTDCVRFRATFEERDNPLAPNVVLIQSGGGFVCRHPHAANRVVFASYSERRPSGAPTIVDDSLKEDAEALLATIVFTPIR